MSKNRMVRLVSHKYLCGWLLRLLPPQPFHKTANCILAASPMSSYLQISALERRNAWEDEVTVVDDVNFSGSMHDTVPSVLPLSARDPSPTAVPTVTEVWATAPNGPKPNKRGSIVVPKEARRSISNQFAHLRANQGVVTATNRGSIPNGMTSPRLASANRKVEGSDEPEGFKHEDAFEYEGLDVREWESLPYVPPSIDKVWYPKYAQLHRSHLSLHRCFGSLQGCLQHGAFAGNDSPFFTNLRKW
jgi:hypothetical protein